MAKVLSKGTILIYEVIIIGIFSLVMLPILGNATGQLKLILSTVNREQALQIAEAGINYYQWRLAHFPGDYQDGTGVPGPYIHDYKDQDTQIVVGRYSLEITPPPVGSTVVTIKSTGYTDANPNQKRVITARYGIPSLAQYAFLTSNGVWIGDTESVSGQLHANNGIRFDGTGNAPISSSRETYTCFAWQGSPCPASKPGIWGAASQSTKNFWEFPVPVIDFSTITSDLDAMRTKSQNGGIYLPPSSSQGYSLVFNSNNTVTIYKVTSLRSHSTGWDVNYAAHNEDLDYNARTELSVCSPSPCQLPSNG
ncbi:MAG: pilus assembly PilX N-terminal domain-containing protein, partial [bacterium]|nr:pilus assembly PilX N-terminal domain-containing protein [bacterium]